MKKALASRMKLSSMMLGLTLLMPAAGQAADTMNDNMQTMQKDMGDLKSKEHCMPNMTAHCQMIADFDYMTSRMADMKSKMQFCMSNQKDCPMPEMVGEMGAMNRKMGDMMQSMQGIAAKTSPRDSSGRMDVQHQHDHN